jgi:YfiH family protein
MTEALVLQKEENRYRLKVFEALGAEAFFTARPLDMAFESPGRRRALVAAGIDIGNLVCPAQVHGDRILVVGRRHMGAGVEGRRTAVQDTDALVTGEKGIALSVLTADCLPVFMLDAEKKVIAMVHAGWRGLHLQIVSRAMAVMAEVFGSRPQDVLAAFGPAVGPCCYQVGEEFASTFPAAVAFRGRSVFMDLALCARRELEACGVPKEGILESGICTSCRSEEFYSYRRLGAAAGRQMSVLKLY